LQSAQSHWDSTSRQQWLATYGDTIEDVRAALDWAFSSKGDLQTGASLFCLRGPCGVVRLPDGKTVTGFMIEGELIFRILDKLRQDNVVPVVEAVTKAGAFYSGAMGAFDDYSITCGRLTTGTNPASARSSAERAVAVFDSLQRAD
jgi:putative intracellular protease/amidase